MEAACSSKDRWAKGLEVVLNAVEVLVIGPESWDKELGEFFDDASQVGIIWTMAWMPEMVGITV